ncbi:MAG: carboxypeptidase regulatory-like domain-containing protein [Bacteroidota bacterium]
MVRYFLLSLIFVLVSTMAMAQTSIYGKIKDADADGEGLIGANVALFENGVLVAGQSTDFDGNYKIDIDPGTYDIEVSYVGYPTKRTTGVLVKAGQATKLDIELGAGDEGTGITLSDVIVTAYKVPLIEQDNTTSGQTITGEQIRNLPTKDVTALAAQAAGLSQADEGDNITVRGSRDNATDYYIDGIRVRGSGSLIPQSEIDQLQVITGGIEAQYGDVTGGIISITTKGPSSRYTGALEVETSRYLDAYDYDLLSGNLSGPIIRNKDGASVLGFRISGQYRHRLDDDPPGTDIFRVKDEVLADLEENPIRRIGATKIPAAEFLTEDDVEVLDFQPNEQDERVDLTAKIDARLSDAIDVTFTGSYSIEEDRFTPGGGSLTGANWRLLNTQNNPTDTDVRYRGNFRFRHRLSGASGLSAEGSDAAAAKKSSLIQNAQYTLQFGYEKREFDRSDPRHGDNFFNYGYIGNFDYQWVPVAGPTPVGGRPISNIDYRQEFLGYTPGTVNPGLANYNDISDAGDINDFVALNGQFVGNVTEAWNFHTNVNQVFNSYNLRENEIYTLNVSSSFDLVPGGTAEKGRHSIQFGILYEQRFNRGYDLAPRGLWNVARLQANRNILGVDTTNIIGVFDPGAPFNTFPGLDTIPQYGTLTDTPEGLLFYQRVREATNQGLGEYVNVDGLTPDQLSLDMFSPQELTDQNLLNYWGYDYLGNPLGNDVTFDDFFNAVDANGVRTFPVATDQPIYTAAYIQDKFTFRDIIFRLGLRVDRFDANTKVLRDPFSLYEIQNAADFYAETGEARPPAVQDDFKVYVEGEGSNTVRAFRRGEQWYFPDGNPANDGNVIFGGQVVTPKLADPENSDIKRTGFDTNLSFEDYEPQINWMPRLAFSFPISEAANFFANYDILVQRPASNNRVSALQYFYFNERTPTDNPNLRPSRTINYEVGFQQRLSNSSAIKISAYYKELRDMIQVRTFLFVPSPINTYDSFDNLDFGTVKGFSFQYDLRRTGNVTLNANYTLQFADGTGSDAISQRGLTNRGNIRTLFPLNFDERHRIVTTLDYRYAKGKSYNGPTLFGKDVLSNFGVNLQMVAVSGRPYTAKLQPSKLDGIATVGQINGARLPWNYTLNLRVDKTFDLSSKGEGGKKRSMGLNIYLRVQNLLDRRNIIRVYPASGSATDDGYLESPFGIGEIATIQNTGRDVQSFLNAYQWRVLNPNFYSLPRRIFLGAIFDF